MKLHNKLLWIVGVVVVLSAVTYLLGMWPAGLGVPVAAAWLLGRHYEHLITQVPRLLASAVPLDASYHIDYVEERRRTQEMVSQIFTPPTQVLVPTDDPTLEELAVVPRAAAETEQDKKRKQVANLLRAGKTDRRTLAKSVLGADTKENRDEIDELIMEIVERIQL